MNELLDQIVNLIGAIPPFVWIIGFGLLLVVIGVIITLVISVISFIRKQKGEVLVGVARKTVSKGFDHAKEILNSEVDEKAATRRYISQMKEMGMSDMQIKGIVEQIIKEHK